MLTLLIHSLKTWLIIDIFFIFYIYLSLSMVLETAPAPGVKLRIPMLGTKM